MCLYTHTHTHIHAHTHVCAYTHTHIHTHKCNQFDGAGADEFPENVGEPVAERIIEYTRVPIDTIGCTGWLWLQQQLHLCRVDSSITRTALYIALNFTAP